MGLSCTEWVTGSSSDGAVPQGVRTPSLPETRGLLLLHLPSKPKTGLRLRDTFGYRRNTLRLPLGTWHWAVSHRPVGVSVLGPALTCQAVQHHHLLMLIDVHGVHQELKET